MDSKAKNVITLLGGHKQGGDRFARELAASLEAEVICTSDSFTERRIPLDCFGEGWGWKRGGENVDWRKLMISQSKEQKNIVFQAKGSKLWQKLKGCSNFSFFAAFKYLFISSSDDAPGRMFSAVFLPQFPWGCFLRSLSTLTLVLPSTAVSTKSSAESNSFSVSL